MPHDVLISYSSHDKLRADAICNRLEAQAIRCWIAPRDVPLGSEYAASIVDAIGAAKVMVLVYSRHADESAQVKREVERAVSEGISIMPVRIEDAPLGKAMEYYVGSIHWLDAITEPFDAHIEKIAQSLKVLLELDAPPKPKPEPKPVPLPEKEKQKPTPRREPKSLRRIAVIAGAAIGLVVAGVAVKLIFFPPQPDVAVLNVSGTLESAAKQTLETRGFSVTIEPERSNEPGGTAIRSDPVAGELAPHGSRVKVFVSGMVTLPTLVGLTEDDARRKLTALRVGSFSLASEQIKIHTLREGVEGKVLRSEPQPGSELLISDTVTLFVAGPTVKVPDVVRKKEADAKIAIEAAQLEALIALDWVASSEVGTVLKTEPAAESSVQRQTKVTLYVTGKGGWLYREGNNFAVGQTVTMRSAGTLRKTPATTGAVAGGAVIAGDKVKVLEKAPYGWVKVVVVPN